MSSENNKSFKPILSVPSLGTISQNGSRILILTMVLLPFITIPLILFLPYIIIARGAWNRQHKAWKTACILSVILSIVSLFLHIDFTQLPPSAETPFTQFRSMFCHSLAIGLIFFPLGLAMTVSNYLKLIKKH